VITNKIVLNDFDIEAFYLCAIHANIPSYKMAFLLNRQLSLQLQRAENDVEINHLKHQNEIYPKYMYNDDMHYITYTLIKNKCVVDIVRPPSPSGDLFNMKYTTQKTKKLISEYKKVDYFLKIETESDTYPLKIIVSQILKIKQVITSYEVNYNEIKKKTNLIFE